MRFAHLFASLLLLWFPSMSWAQLDPGMRVLFPFPSGTLVLSLDNQVTAARSGSGNNGGSGALEIYFNTINSTQAGIGSGRTAIPELEFASRPFSIIQYVENSKDGKGVTVQNGLDAKDTLCNEYQIHPGKSAFTFKFLQSKTNGTAVVNTYEGSSADGVVKLILKATAAGSETDIDKQSATSISIDKRIKFDIGVDVTKPKFELNTIGVCGRSYQIAIRSSARSSSSQEFTKLQRIQAGGSVSPVGLFTGTGTANVNATNFQEQDDDKIRSKQTIHSFDSSDPDMAFDVGATTDTTTSVTGGNNHGKNNAAATGISMVAMAVATMVGIFAQ